MDSAEMRTQARRWREIARFFNHDDRIREALLDAADVIEAKADELEGDTKRLTTVSR